eukprot:TRINITY_DN19859_c0_g1_i1.p1 TRINITY_DN19859_c0_g1~~TRINITY_DN19859_c0_g1_i1.p1  ORF type:complete len:431 (-),score=75.34 TRINITY_DN19859_c0_g1_i1:392-1684(-)
MEASLLLCGKCAGNALVGTPTFARVSYSPSTSPWGFRPLPLKPAAAASKPGGLSHHKKKNLYHHVSTFKLGVACASANATAGVLTKDLDAIERNLLEAIAGVRGRGRAASEAQKNDIAEAVKLLEDDGGVSDPVQSPLIEGKWQLMYTTRPGTASPIQRTFVGVDAFTVYQEVVLRGTDDPRISNIVQFSESVGLLKVEALATVAEGGKRIKFQFDRAAFDFKALPFKVPYPVPFKLLGDEAKGWLDTTYLSQSGDVRISRGNKGTTFVLQKNPSPRQRLLQAANSGRNVEKAIEEIVPLNPTAAPAASEMLPGKWRLIWSSQASDANPLQKLGTRVTNFQLIDAETSRLENLVEVAGGFLKLRAGASTKTASDIRTDVNIDGGVLEIGALSIPLKFLVGQGYVEQLYLDDKVRISRGNKGSLFIHVRDS